MLYIEKNASFVHLLFGRFFTEKQFTEGPSLDEFVEVLAKDDYFIVILPKEDHKSHRTCVIRPQKVWDAGDGTFLCEVRFGLSPSGYGVVYIDTNTQTGLIRS